jgi:hypothetical protein
MALIGAAYAGAPGINSADASEAVIAKRIKFITLE